MLKCLSRIEMVCNSPETLADFYESAFGFSRLRHVVGIPRSVAEGIGLQLGKQKIALISVEPPGKPYRSNVAGWNPLFQHIAIVVSDMASAYAHLSNVRGWMPISTSGPQILPAASGSVSAFKFRDPEGHPLELISYSRSAIPDQWRSNSKADFLGIDHSAVSVLNTQRSVIFYQSLGLHRKGGSLNVGLEQAKLDDVPNAVVEVTALLPSQSTPHVELLCYRGNFDRNVHPQAANDGTATRLVFSFEGRRAIESFCTQNAGVILRGPALDNDNVCRALIRDPDGHLICLEANA
jgi:catechol 2,3-dioxygenase-like lactoylglutathione lyase family enzyme